MYEYKFQENYLHGITTAGVIKHLFTKFLVRYLLNYRIDFYSKLQSVLETRIIGHPVYRYILYISTNLAIILS